MTEGKKLVRQAFKELEQQVPDRLARVLRWLRHPASRWVRIPAGIFLLLGGIFSILPGLGIWMLPVGLLLLAIDVPFLQKPIGRFTMWGVEKWAAFRQSRKTTGKTETSDSPGTPRAADTRPDVR